MVNRVSFSLTYSKRADIIIKYFLGIRHELKILASAKAVPFNHINLKSTASNSNEKAS